MASEIKLPVLGENLSEGEVLDVTVSPGDVVSEGQKLLEIEAEKSTVEVPSPVAGRLTQVLVKKGEVVKTGQPLFLIEAGAAAKPEPPPEPAAPQQDNLRQKEVELER